MAIRAPLALVVLTGLGLACGPAAPPGTDSAAVDSGAPSSAEPVVEVTTRPLRRGAIAQSVSAPGSLRARRESPIGAEVRGRIEKIYVSEGDRVEAGAPLFQIDPAPYEVALRQAEAGLDLARAERLQLEADLQRLRALHKKEIVSAEQLDRLETQLAVSRARERQAAEGVAMAQHNLERTRVVAPYSGSIATRLVDEGTTALVQPQTIVVVLQETADLEAEASIPESQLPAVQVGDPARVWVQGLPEPIETRVAAVGDTIDPATRTYRVSFVVPNADHRLKAGIFARIEILPQAKTEALLVPREAIRSEDGRTRVMVVRDGHAVPVPIQLGIVSEREVEVLSGVPEGSEIIVGDAAREIAPGMAVRVVSGAQDPPS